MLKSKKICVVSGSRAEYGLLKEVIFKLHKSKYFNLKFVVTGSHLSKKYGFTLKEIQEDRIPISKLIDINLGSDNPVGVSKSMSIGLNKFVKIYEKLEPDLILVLGDRYEILSAGLAATLCRIPIAHIHGGEITQAALDDVFRHCLTKMAHIHFSATKDYKKRIVQLGENPKNVFNVGGLGVDAIKKCNLYTKKNIENKLNFKFKKKNILVTCHPETLNEKSSKRNFQEIINALNRLNDVCIVFTMPNHDIDNQIIKNMILKFVNKKRNSFFFKSLGQKMYFSFCAQVDCLVGNSSSGLLEMPTFKKFTINIGDRQKGRLKAKSVIDCKFNTTEILKKINFTFSINNKKKIMNVKNPYGDGGASDRIFSILKRVKLDQIINKEFYNLKK